MRERLCEHNVTLVDPTEANSIATLEGYFQPPFDITIVAVSVSPLADDASATLDIDDDGTNVITAIDASDANVPGTWLTPGFGGTNTPVVIAADSKVSFDINSGAAANAFYVCVWYLVGSQA